MPFVHLPYICRSFDLFFASLLFMKGISYCVIRRKLEPLDRAMANLRGHRSARFPLLSGCSFIEFDTSIIYHLLVYCFGSFLLQVFFLKSPSICFQGTKYNIYCECVAYSHSVQCDAGPAMIRAVCEYSSHSCHIFPPTFSFRDAVALFRESYRLV